MHYQERTDESHESQHTPVITDPLVHNQNQWINYINSSGADRNPASTPNLYRLALTEQMYTYELRGRTLFHLTVTYRPYENRQYLERDVNTFFINFYTKKLLPYLLGTKNIHTNAKKSIQPICYCFIDEHEMDPVKKSSMNPSTNLPDDRYEFPVRLHHHAILALHPDTVSKARHMIGANTFRTNEFSPKIMTSDFKECEPMRLLYASKMLRKYPDFLLFPDSLIRHHRH